MRKSVVMAAALVLLAGAARAWAGEIEGKITAVDTSDRTIQLDYFTVISVAEGVPMDNLQEGATVKASYEERDDTKVATKVTVTE